LTHALNDYISEICKKILENGGDILKFAGDAILALWRVNNRKTLGIVNSPRLVTTYELLVITGSQLIVLLWLRTALWQFRLITTGK
jgi:class 3 adenylate cyclase